MLKLGDENLVAGAYPEPRGLASRGGGIAHRVRDEVHGLGRALGEHDLADGRADERRYPGPGGLVGVGGLLAEQVGAAMRRRVVDRVEVPLGVEHLARLVRGGPGVEVDKGPAAAHGSPEDREVGADRGHVERAGGRGPEMSRGGGHAAASAFRNFS
jgi:hypothetical protein